MDEINESNFDEAFRRWLESVEACLDFIACEAPETQKIADAQDMALTCRRAFDRGDTSALIEMQRSFRDVATQWKKSLE